MATSGQFESRLLGLCVSRLLRSGVLFLIWGMLVGHPDTCPGQARKAAPKANLPQLPDIPETPIPASVDLLGDANPAEPGAVVQDGDETPEGRQRLAEIEIRARELYAEAKVVHEKRAPFAVPRDQMAAVVRGQQQGIAANEAVIGKLAKAEDMLQRQLAVATPQQANNIQGQINGLVNQAATLRRQIDVAIGVIRDLIPKIEALNIQITPYDNQLVQLFKQLEEARKQWVKIRQPVDKYARGEFELPRKVLDDWLLIDGHWAEAQGWGCLCAIEAGDSIAALDYLDKAVEIRKRLDGNPKPWPWLEAISALVYYNQKGKTPDARKAAKNAELVLDKKTDWMTWFLIGRCYIDRGSEIGKARTSFQKAIDINPRCVCANLWLGRIETTSTKENVRDVTGGIKRLEKLWKSTGQRSWRQAWFLAEAYVAGDRSDDAERMWDTALTLAPVEQHKMLETRRAGGGKVSGAKTSPRNVASSKRAG